MFGKLMKSWLSCQSRPLGREDRTRKRTSSPNLLRTPLLGADCACVLPWEQVLDSHFSCLSNSSALCQRFENLLDISLLAFPLALTRRSEDFLNSLAAFQRSRVADIFLQGTMTCVTSPQITLPRYAFVKGHSDHSDPSLCSIRFSFWRECSDQGFTD